MSTEKTIRDKKHELAKAGDFDAFHRLEREEWAARLEAINRGIEEAESRSYQTRELTQLARCRGDGNRPPHHDSRGGARG